MITRTMQRPGTRSVMGETKERQHRDWQNKMSMESKHWHKEIEGAGAYDGMSSKVVRVKTWHCIG